MEFLLIIAGIAVLVGCFLLYGFIMNRGKNCPSCKAKFDSSCIEDAQVVRTVPTTMGADYSDVKVKLRCKKCGRIHTTTVTVRGNASDRYLDNEIMRHFDK